jgi:hypothetical protein
LRTLSAIYSQLGNAYFYLGDYSKAMQYHKLDLTLARSMNDRLGEGERGILRGTLMFSGRIVQFQCFSVMKLKRFYENSWLYQWKILENFKISLETFSNSSPKHQKLLF